MRPTASPFDVTGSEDRYRDVHVYVRGVSRTSKAIRIVAFILTTTQQSALNERPPSTPAPSLFHPIYSPRRDPLFDVTHYSSHLYIQLVLGSGPRLTTYFPINSQISERSPLINASTRPPEITTLPHPNCLSIAGVRTPALMGSYSKQPK